MTIVWFMETVILTWDDGQASPVLVDATPDKLSFKGQTFEKSDTLVDGCKVYTKGAPAPESQDPLVHPTPAPPLPPPTGGTSPLEDWVVSAPEPQTVMPQPRVGIGADDWPSLEAAAPAPFERVPLTLRTASRLRIEEGFSFGAVPYTGYHGGCKCFQCCATNIMHAFTDGDAIPNRRVQRYYPRPMSPTEITEWFRQTFAGWPDLDRRMSYHVPVERIQPMPVGIQMARDPQRLAGQRLTDGALQEGIGRIQAQITRANELIARAPSLAQPRQAQGRSVSLDDFLMTPEPFPDDTPGSF